MVSQKTVIHLATGMHARPASALVSFAKKYKSKIFIKYGEKQANCSSIISLLALGAKGGTEVEVIADGEDEVTALPEVVAFIDKLED